MKPRTPKLHPAKPESLKLRFLGLAAALAAACAFAAPGRAAEPIERRSAELAEARVAAATEGTATRPALAANERGDLALVPYYTVREQWVTGLHIVNTSDRTQVVKVRFRRATDAMGALDFNLVMAPRDVYAGFLSRDVNGAIVWSSADTTCTVPAAQSQRLTMPAIYRADAETGHIEIIAMGTPRDERQPIALAARHAPAAAPARFGAPLDCAAVRSNFFADGAGTFSRTLKISRTLKKGVENQATTWQAPSAAPLSLPNAAAAIRAGGRNVYEDSGNVLKVSYFIRDNAAGIEFGDNAVHIRDFLARPAITNQQYSVLSGDLNGFSFPDLNGGVPRSSAPGDPGPAKPVKRARFDALRAALGARAVLNGSGFGELSTGAFGVEMDWVLTLPGQYLMLKLPQYVASLSGAGQAWAPTTASDGAPMDNPRCPRRATAAGCDYRDQPLKLAFEAYGPEQSPAREASTAGAAAAVKGGLWSTLLDRFSGKPTRPASSASNGTMSPAPTPSRRSPRLSARVVLPKATNVISFGGGPAAGQRGVLGISDAHVSATPPYDWVRARVKSADNDLRVCDWDFAHDLGAGFGAAAGAALNDTLRCSPVTHSDAPLIGFAAFRSRRVAANPAAAYGRIVEHSYERARASAEQEPAFSDVALNAPPVAPMRRRFSAPARAALAAPANLRLSWGDTQATASWTGVRGASSYTLYYSQSSLAGVTNPATASGVTRVANLSGASHTLTGLSNDVTYYVVVTARNASGESAPSTPASVTPQAPTSAPAVPSGLRLSAGDAQVRAGWAATAGARTYTLYYSASSLADVSNLSGLTASQLAAAGIARVANLTGLAHTVTGLSNGSRYFVAVAAANASGQSAASSQASAIPHASATALAAPGDLRLVEGNARATATWAGVPDARSYTLYYARERFATMSAPPSAVYRGLAGGTRVTGLSGAGHTVTGLSNGVRYYVVVTAENATGEGVASAEVSVTPQVPTRAPRAPRELRLVAGNAQVTASWRLVDNAGTYTLYYSESSLDGVTVTELATRDGVTRVANLSGASHTVTGLSNDRPYYFVVTANNAIGQSAASSQASATPVSAAPATPGGLSLAAGNTRVTATWNEVSGASTYTLYYSTASLAGVSDFTTRSDVTRVANIAGAAHTVPYLANGSPYYFVVMAANAIGESAPSAQVSATPRAPTAATAPEVFRDTLKDGGQGPEMVVLPAGYFRMGSPPGEVGRESDEEPLRTVSLDRRLAMGRYEVTFADYDRFARAKAGVYRPRDEGWGRGMRPVINVSWNEAQVYAAWLSVQTGNTYRLPTEAEWEYAARAGTSTPYSWGDSIDYFGCSSPANFLGGRFFFAIEIRDIGCGARRTLPIGGYAANPFGLHNMHGNVREWVEDCHGDYSAAPSDGSAVRTGAGGAACNRRVVRGGGWASIVFDDPGSGLPDSRPLRSASRTFAQPVIRYGSNGGFRLVREVTTAAPATPSGLSLVAGSTRVTATWSATRDASRYTLYYSESSFAGVTDLTAPGITPVANITAISRTVSGLTNGTTYYFVVRASNAGGDSAVSSEVSATPQVPAPAMPSGLRLTAGNEQVRATWDTISGATSYTLYYSQSSITDINASSVTAVPNIAGTSHTVSGLTNGTTYHFVVKASNAGGESAVSREVSATPQVPAPGVPSGLSLTAGNAQVEATWTAVSGASRYTLYYSQSSFTSLTAEGVTKVESLTGTSRTVSGLTNGTRYYFRITATNAGGESAASSEVSAMPQVPAPGAPSGLSLTAGNAQVEATWTAVSGASRYTLYYSQSSFTSLTASGVTKVENLNGPPHTVSDLTNGTTYYFRVTASNAGGESAASDQASATPLAPPGAPSGLLLTAGNGQVEASWTAGTGVSTTYTLYYSQSSFTSVTASGVTVVPNLTGTSHIQRGLTNGTTYYFRVTASNASGESTASDQVSATPLAPPGAPSGLSLTAGNGQVTATWTAGTGVSSTYTLYYSQSSFTSLTASGVTKVENLTGTSHIQRGLTNGTRYYFRVTASNVGGQSAASNEASATPLAPPGAPSGLNLNAGNAQVTANWTAGTGTSSTYTLYHSQSPISSLTATGVTAVPGLTTTSRTVSGLTNGRRYYFKVTASNTAGGQGDASAQAFANPQLPFSDPLQDSTQSGPEMVALPTGSFSMGSPTGEAGGSANERPQHTVTISRRIAMSRYQVTFDDYSRFVTAKSGTRNPGDQGWGRATRPVININQNEAKAYAVWLSAQTGKSYRLPTEAEWEYAARAGTSTRYSWGDAIGSNRANCNNCGSEWDNTQTAPVGSFAANGFGLHDLHGNVYEWVEDCWHDNYNEAPTDGSVWTASCPSDGSVVVRGGSWNYGPLSLRSASRFKLSSLNRDNGDNGFRLVKDLSPFAPASLSLSAGNTQVTASWTRADGASKYTLYYSQSSLAGVADLTELTAAELTTASITRVEDITGASHTVSGLTNGTLYYFVVTASNADGESGASSEASATPQASAVATPGNLRLTAGNAQVAASWTAITGASGYTLYHSPTANLAGNLTRGDVTPVAVSGTSHTVPSLTNGTTYYFVVVSRYTGGQSAASSEESATPQVPAPGGFSVTAGNGQVTASWSAVTNADGYNLYYSRSPNVDSRSGDVASVRDAETAVTRVPVTGTSHTVPSLTNGATYYFIVKAKNASGGEGPASSEESATPQVAAPVNLNLTAGNRQVTASWSAVANASGYNLYYSTRANIATNTSRAGVARVADITGTSRLLTGLTNGTRYYFIVKAKNASGGEGPASTERSAIPATPTGAFEDSLLSGGKAPRMVVVSDGRFTRGSRNDDTTGEANERPSHNVTFGYSFAIGSYEVSFADWDLYVDSQKPKPHSPTAPHGRGQKPVVLVSWDDVTTATTGYLAWLSRQTGNTYRLPTEAEWEYATRAGTTTAYHFGDDITCQQVHYGRDTSDVAPKSRVCNPPTINADGSRTWSPKSPKDVSDGTGNAWGLVHVHGNVSEFVQDCYVGNYIGAFNNGRARTICPGTTNRVLRGGSWILLKSYQRSAKRDGIPPGRRSNTVGFRVAQDLN